MALVAAKCPNCGGNLEVDPKNDAGVCPFCNTPYITQKAIINYNTTIINNNTINADTVNIIAGDFDKLLTKAKNSFDSDDVQDAYDSACKALEFKPDDEEAQLIKSICASYLKMDLSPAYTTFVKLFKDKQPTDENSDFINKYLLQYLHLIVSAYTATAQNYVANVDAQDNLLHTFKLYDDIIKNHDYAITILKKLYDYDDKYKQDYIECLKGFCKILARCSEKHDYLWIIDANGKHYKKAEAPNKDTYLQLKEKYEQIILELDPNYQTEEIKNKVNSNVVLWWVIAGVFVIAFIIMLAVLL